MKIAIIGGGNMGGAIARGLTKGSLVRAEDIAVSAATEATLAKLTAFDSRIKVSTNNLEVVTGADMVIFAVKPWLLDRVVTEVTPRLNPSGQIYVSVVAGVSFEHLSELLGVGSPMFRVMPNTAIALGQSMTVVASYNADAAQEELVLSLFNEMGKSLLVPERLMTACTALGSCGTAFALRYIRAAMEAGVEMGLYPYQAQEIVAQTVKGAAELLLQGNTHPEAEIDKVTTPGGITIKGLNEMEQAGFTSAVIRGVKACR